MSAERKLQRAQAQAGFNAVDLSSIKGDRQKQMLVAENAMRQSGFLCSCGTRFGTEAVQAMGYNLGRFPSQVMTAQGHQIVTDDGAQLMIGSYCSRTCIDFLDALKNGLQVNPGSGVRRPKVVALRDLPNVEWLDEDLPEAA